MRSAGSPLVQLSPHALHSIDVTKRATLPRHVLFLIAPILVAFCRVSSAETQLGGRVGRGGARAKPAKPDAPALARVPCGDALERGSSLAESDQLRENVSRC